MTRHLKVSVLSDTKAIKEATFGDILIIDFKKAIPYTKVSDTTALKSLSVLETDIIYKKIEKIFSQPNRIDKVSIFGTTAENDSIKSELDNMWAKNKGYYFVLMSEFDNDKTKSVVEWAVGKGLRPVYLTDNNKTADEAVTFFKELNNGAIAFATNKENDYPDAIYVGLMCTDTPGRDKWEWKEGAGAVVSGFDLTDIDKLEEAGINTVQEEREGVLGLFPGKCANGEFIDIEWGRDNLQYDIETAFIRAEKAPYKIYHPGVDPRGVTQIEGIVNSIIKDYASDFREFIAKDEQGKVRAKITVKTEYTQQQIAAREFEVAWAAIPSGSASYGEIKGLLTFDKTKVGGAS